MTEAISKSPKGRVIRTPMSGRNVLTVKGKDPGYEYRIVNDTDDRIEYMQGIGYELVKKDSVQVGDSRVSATSPEGSAKQLSVGQGVKAFVMRIKKEWYEDDQRVKQNHILEQENAIKTPPQPGSGTYGSLDISKDK